MILDGNKAAKHIKCNITRTIGMNPLPRRPHLAIIQVGNEAASNNYIKYKRKDAEECNIRTTLFNFPIETHYIVAAIRDRIERLNDDEGVDGIMVQLPIPGFTQEEAQYYTDKILNTIAADKDVDGLNSGSEHRFTGAHEGFPPCTPDGIRMLLDYYKINPERKKCVVIGRSKLVGYPTAKMLMDMGGTVSVCHSKTDESVLKQEVYESSIIVSAVGKAGMFKETDLNLARHPTVIDVGTSLGADGKLHGDFSFDLLDHCNDHDLVNYTPVPGGVGPMTRAALMAHVTDAFIYHMRKAGHNVSREKSVGERRPASAD